MSWLDGGWKQRKAIAVDNTGGGTVLDIKTVIPTDFEVFWEAIDASGAELRVTLADGITAIDYDITGFSKTNRTCDLWIDALSAAATDSTPIIWLYFDNSGASDQSQTLTIGTWVNGKVETVCAPADRVLRARPPKAGATQPEIRLSKTSLEQVHVWIDVDRLLERRCAKYADSLRAEEIDYLSYEVVLAGQPQASMVDETQTRLVDSGLCRLLIKAGTNNSDYTISLTVGTTTGRVLNPRALMLVRDIDED